ncbi:hypothetical protein [Methylorubrum extorquens]|uniref:Uncharacterized protein n=1 Tax=Methylorubrum extorquens (strain ATCC 14718 / DSM 1338 / JCM 2805 / NCIMB 9133 / AM1) TaxID=272630 RepID=C5B0P7_METEA|nr:hypothetical protein [Methylorubrum extorquens]ACS41634.1 Hypothetical protein MexAM1_META1p3952 [Methylorubrum extorquens AM1]MCP1545354.1 hypothetical protein [Methylorubrum extorquens]MCP1587299.1 hypothetical protein [Methylorubrum extorquens]
MSRDNGKREADLAIKKVLVEHGETWNAGTVWRVQGTAVISHKALERIAARAGIRFDKPDVLRAERDEAVMLVVGRRGDLTEWSVGEALVNVNYRVSGRQAGYVWAMAEKRAKDRVILKLLALHGIAYSEEEADDLKDGKRDAATEPADEPGNDEPEPNEGDSRAAYLEACKRTIAAATDAKVLRDWWLSGDEKAARRDFGLSQDETDSLKTALSDRLSDLGRGGDDTRRAAA